METGCIPELGVGLLLKPATDPAPAPTDGSGFLEVLSALDPKPPATPAATLPKPGENDQECDPSSLAFLFAVPLPRQDTPAARQAPRDQPELQDPGPLMPKAPKATVAGFPVDGGMMASQTQAPPATADQETGPVVSESLRQPALMAAPSIATPPSPADSVKVRPEPFPQSTATVAPANGQQKPIQPENVQASDVSAHPPTAEAAELIVPPQRSLTQTDAPRSATKPIGAKAAQPPTIRPGDHDRRIPDGHVGQSSSAVDGSNAPEGDHVERPSKPLATDDPQAVVVSQMGSVEQGASGPVITLNGEAKAVPHHPHDAAPHSPQRPLPHGLGLQLAGTIARFPEKPVEVTLSPEELGRVRMTLVTTDGALTLSLVADRPETLDLMRRNIDQLAQDFRDMGFHDLTFNFSQGRDSESHKGGEVEMLAEDDDDRRAKAAAAPKAPNIISPNALATAEVDIRL